MEFVDGKRRVRGEIGAEASENIARPSILAVGEVGRWKKAGRGLPRARLLTFANFHEVNAGLLEAVNPDIVISPLLCSEFDCTDLAMVLAFAGFRGRYRAMAHKLPNPSIVRNEIRTNCPSLDFDLLFVHSGNLSEIN